MIIDSYFTIYSKSNLILTLVLTFSFKLEIIIAKKNLFGCFEVEIFHLQIRLEKLNHFPVDIVFWKVQQVRQKI